MLAIAVSAWLLRIRADRGGCAGIAIALVTVIVDGNRPGADGAARRPICPVSPFRLCPAGHRDDLLKRAGGSPRDSLFAGFRPRRAPESQSHLGRFFDEIGSGQALNIVIRKQRSRTSGSLISLELSILVPFSPWFS